MTTNIGIATDSRLGECETSRHSSHHLSGSRRWFKRRCLRRVCCFFGLLLLINICLTASAISKLKHIELQLDTSTMDGPGPNGPHDPRGPSDNMYYGPDNGMYNPNGNGPNSPNSPNSPNNPSGDMYDLDTGMHGSNGPNSDFPGSDKHNFDSKKMCSDLCTEICTSTTCDVFECSETCVSVFKKRHEMRMKYGKTNENIQSLPPTDVSPNYPADQSQPIQPTLSAKNNAISDIEMVNNNDISPNSHNRHSKKDSSSESQNSDSVHYGTQFARHDINRKRPTRERPQRLERFNQM